MPLYKKSWTSSNDGSGSGLDADLLDGLDSASSNTVSTIVARDASGNFSAGAITAIDFNSTSDERKKTDIQTAPSDIIQQLRGVEFRWTENGVWSSGVIAQEVEQIIPNAVSTSEDGFKTVNYNSLIAYLIEAIKDLNTEIEQLKS